MPGVVWVFGEYFCGEYLVMCSWGDVFEWFYVGVAVNGVCRSYLDYVMVVCKWYCVGEVYRCCCKGSVCS